VQLAQTMALYKALGIPLPAGFPGASGAPASAVAAGPQPSAPAAPIAAPSVTPSPTPLPTAPAGPAGLLSPTPTRTPAAPAAPVAAPQPSTMDLIRKLPLADRAVLATGGPAAVTKVVGDVIAKNAEATPDMKNATASGKANPLEYNDALETGKA